jgi:hypothetical protein
VQACARGRRVARDLFAQRCHIGKLLFGPQELAERDFEFAPVEIAFEVEQVHFEHRAGGRGAGERRPVAEVGDAG